MPTFRSVHGTDPQFLIEKIIRERVYDSLFWKEECYNMDIESLLDKAVRLSCIGGTFGGNQKATHFLCLLLKLLQLQPDLETVVAVVKDPEFKYLRVLFAFYLRLIGSPIQLFENLEPLYQDYRKIRVISSTSEYYIMHVDQIVDDLLNKERMFSLVLPRIPKRKDIERTMGLQPRVSPLAAELF